jgi:hypothetical protein
MMSAAALLLLSASAAPAPPAAPTAPTASIVVRTADALVASLNDTAFAEPFTAQRAFRPEFQLAQLADLRVTVVPSATARDLAAGDRRGAARTVSIDLGVQRRVDRSEEGDDVAGLLALVEAIDAATLGRAFAVPASGSLPGGIATCVETEADPIYHVPHLENSGVFTGVLRLTFDLTPGL